MEATRTAVTTMTSVRVKFDLNGSSKIELRHSELFELGFPNASDPSKPSFYNATAVLVEPDTIEVQLMSTVRTVLASSGTVPQLTTASGAIPSHVAYAQFNEPCNPSNDKPGMSKGDLATRSFPPLV